MTAIRVYLDGVSFWTPGIESWEALCRALDAAGNTLPDTGEVMPDSLSPRAARRVSPQIRLAVAMAEKLAPSLSHEAAWVFASSVGEGETLQVMLEALRRPDMMIQPIRFQNAVHNAASGQWSIAAGIKQPMTSIAAHDETVGAGFLKAGMQIIREDRPVGLVFFDVPMPEPINAKRPLGVPLGTAFALSPVPGPTTMAVIDMNLSSAPATAPQSEVSLALAATGNPIADVLPLIERIVDETAGEVIVRLHGGGALRLRVSAP
ncbi:MAG: beta-ketoacyl synthase chain length factor [Pseudomonadota bacterium]